MKRVLILVEGPTEERFVKELLQPHLWNFGVHLEPKIVTTKRTKDGTQFKGGNAFSKVEGDLRRLLGDKNAALVTTMLDYYGLPDDFPGKQVLKGPTAAGKAQKIERALEKHLDAGKRFVGFLMLHEFEAILFVGPTELAKAMNSEPQAAAIQKVRDSFKTVEEINDDPETAPSKRVLKMFPDYRKRLFGPIIAKRIGLATIRQACPHFNEWLTKLESIGAPSAF